MLTLTSAMQSRSWPIWEQLIKSSHVSNKMEKTEIPGPTSGFHIKDPLQGPKSGEFDLNWTLLDQKAKFTQQSCDDFMNFSLNASFLVKLWSGWSSVWVIGGFFFTRRMRSWLPIAEMRHTGRKPSFSWCDSFSFPCKSQLSTKQSPATNTCTPLHGNLLQTPLIFTTASSTYLKADFNVTPAEWGSHVKSKLQDPLTQLADEREWQEKTKRRILLIWWVGLWWNALRFNLMKLKRKSAFLTFSLLLQVKEESY